MAQHESAAENRATFLVTSTFFNCLDIGKGARWIRDERAGVSKVSSFGETSGSSKRR